MPSYFPGILAYFNGYIDGRDWGLSPGDLLGVPHADADGVLTCYRVDWRERVFERESYLTFTEEVRFLPAPPLPMRRFPPPWGVSDNEEEHRGFVWTGSRMGIA